MGSSPEAAEARDAAEARLLGQLRASLERAVALAARVRQALIRGDVEAIETATAQLASVAEAFKALAAAYADDPDSRRSDGTRPPGVLRARAALRDAVARLARQAAVDGALLERFVQHSQTLLGIVTGQGSEAYLPSGRAAETLPEGLKLTEWV